MKVVTVLTSHDQLGNTGRKTGITRRFEKVHTAANGQLITGQNPASSGPAARLLIDPLKGNWK